MSAPSETTTPVVREARPEELDRLTAAAVRAFLTDPIFNYAGNVQIPLYDSSQSHGRESLRIFLRFNIKGWMLRGGRVVVVAAPQPGGAPDELMAACIWAPPGCRLDTWRAHTMAKSGFYSALGRWGLKGFMRLVPEHTEKADAGFRKAFKQRKMKVSPKGAVYLALAFTDPAHQGKGLIGKVIREAFEYYPNQTFTLETGTEKARAVYAHYGYEEVGHYRLGAGKVNEEGLPVPKGEKASGVPGWSMVKWVTP